MQIFDPPPPPAERSASRRHLPALPGIPLPAFARRPLTWVIAAEAVVTFAFLAAALHLLAASIPAPPSGAAAALPTPPPASTLPPPNVAGLLPGGSTVSTRPRTGLGSSSAFLGGLLSGLNSDQSSFEHAEWSALQALSGAIRTYIEGVVVPAVEKAAHRTAASRSP